MPFFQTMKLYDRLKAWSSEASHKFIVKRAVLSRFVFLFSLYHSTYKSVSQIASLLLYPVKTRIHNICNRAKWDQLSLWSHKLFIIALKHHYQVAYVLSSLELYPARFNLIFEKWKQFLFFMHADSQLFSFFLSKRN